MTATDVVLTVTDMLRQHGVVGKFVEFYGRGVSRQVPLANRATRQHEPEFGSTCAIFPIDGETINYLRLTGRTDEERSRSSRPTPRNRACGTTRARAGVLRTPRARPEHGRPVDRRARSARRTASSCRSRRSPSARTSTTTSRSSTPPSTLLDEAVEESFPASTWLRCSFADDGAVNGSPPPTAREGRPSKPVHVSSPEYGDFVLDHGAVAVAGITSCTNTSNPSVMIGAGSARPQRGQQGPRLKPWVKTNMAPGSQVVSDYYEKAGLWPYLEKLGFYLGGYGCTTCIGNTGPLPDVISKAVQRERPAVTAGASGNRNFEGRINPDVKMNYLASPPLVIAYALAGTMDFDFETQPLGTGHRRQRRLPEGHLAVGPRRSTTRSRRRSTRTCSASPYADVFRATSAGRTCRPRR